MNQEEYKFVDFENTELSWMYKSLCYLSESFLIENKYNIF